MLTDNPMFPDPISSILRQHSAKVGKFYSLDLKNGSGEEKLYSKDTETNGTAALFFPNRGLRELVKFLHIAFDQKVQKLELLTASLKTWCKLQQLVSVRIYSPKNSILLITLAKTKLFLLKNCQQKN